MSSLRSRVLEHGKKISASEDEVQVSKVQFSTLQHSLSGMFPLPFFLRRAGSYPTVLSCRKCALSRFPGGAFYKFLRTMRV